MQLYIVVIEYSDTSLLNPVYLDDILNDLGKNVKLTSTSYLVRSEANAVDLRSSILAKDSDIERIFVTTCNAPSAWRGMIGSNEDIKSLLRDE